MKRLIMILGATLALAACNLPAFNPAQPPAPLAQTTIDDAGLSAAWKSFDAALDAIDLLVDANVLKPGTPRAVGIADGIDKVKVALQTAERAAAAGSATDYRTALAEAKAALDGIRTLLRSN